MSHRRQPSPAVHPWIPGFRQDDGGAGIQSGYFRPKVSSAFFMLPDASAMNFDFASGLLKQ